MLPLLIVLAYFLADVAGLVAARTGAGWGVLVTGVALVLVAAQGNARHRDAGV